MRDKILVTGACGQLGTELVAALRQRYGWDRVIATDIHPATDVMQNGGVYMKLDVLNMRRLSYLFERLGIGQVYHLAAVVSAAGEGNPLATWELNMQGLINVLEACRAQNIQKVFWPSSIAVFGPGSQKDCSQRSAPDPLTVYGISKTAGEYWCRWYRSKYGMDIRSIRYPGLISHSAQPGGGTTDYAVDIFHCALQHGHYACFLKADTRLPMLYMPDAVRGTLQLMDAPAEKSGAAASYNLSGLHFTPAELAAAIRLHLPGFEMDCFPDHRQQIAEGWPATITDTEARRDWGWQPAYDLPAMVADMLAQLQPQYADETKLAG